MDKNGSKTICLEKGNVSMQLSAGWVSGLRSFSSVCANFLYPNRVFTSVL